MRCYARDDAIEVGDILEAFSLQLFSVRKYASGMLDDVS
jgi:hypothetical protein